VIRFVTIDEDSLSAAREIYDYYSLHSTATFRDKPIIPEEFRKSMDVGSQVYPSFLIRENGIVLGYCCIRRYNRLRAYDRTAEVAIYLNAEHTGKGIGKVALGYLEEHARGAGLQVLIGIITGENYPSIRLFESMGYTRSAHLKNVGELSGRLLDVVIYQKDL
jgi:phosphinothricin acetyltransferase